MFLFSDKPLIPGSSSEKKWIFTAIINTLLWTVVDLYTKYLVVSHIAKGNRIPVIPGFFDLTFITNPGAAFGILAGRSVLLLSISAFALFVIVFFFRRITEGWPERFLSVSLILSGIIGNSADRIYRGEVVDFLRVYYNKWEWPSFNIADSCICVGVFIFLISTLCRPEKKDHAESSDSEKNSEQV